MIMPTILTKPSKKPDFILSTLKKKKQKNLKNIFCHNFTISSKANNCMLHNLLYGTFFSRGEGMDLTTPGGLFQAL